MEIGIRPLAIEDYEALVSLWQRAVLKFNPERLWVVSWARVGDFLGDSLREAGGGLNLLMGFDAIFLAMAFTTFEYILEE